MASITDKHLMEQCAKQQQFSHGLRYFLLSALALLLRFTSSNLFNATDMTHISAAKLRALVSHASKKVYLNNGTHQDTVEFFSIMVESIEKELHSEEGVNQSIIKLITYTS